jgi:hypothetical protein
VKVIAVVLAVMLMICCTAGQNGNRLGINAATKITLTVENDNWQPITVLIQRAGVTTRLGRINPNHREIFQIDTDMVRSSYRVLLAPAGTTGRVYSDVSGSRPVYGDLDIFNLTGRPPFPGENLRLCVRDPLAISRWCS